MTLQKRKPRVALMGEFSAGKSTLSNLLLGARPLPEKVTATRLSPVWMSFGTEAPYRVDLDGNTEAFSMGDLDTIPVEQTRVIRLSFEADILQVCDLIDFPGISDPNMSADVWQRMLEEVDVVLWCTHATQAWRQSEAAVWETIPEAVRARSALLITRFDKLTTERDRFRVLARLEKETEGLFAATFPISLTAALAAGDDYDAFEESGGIDFLQFFLEMVDELAEEIGETSQSVYAASQVSEAPATEAPVAETPAADVQVAAPAAASAPAAEETPERAPVEISQAEAAPVKDVVAPEAAIAEDRILPRRVRAKSSEALSARPRSKRMTIDMSDGTQLEMPERPTTRSLRAVFQEPKAAAE